MTLTPVTTLTPLTTEKQKPPHGGGLVGLSLFNCALTPALLFSLKLYPFVAMFHKNSVLPIIYLLHILLGSFSSL
mgnify:CR=1 FL=1